MRRLICTLAWVGAALLLPRSVQASCLAPDHRIAACASRLVLPQDWRQEPGQVWDLAVSDRASGGALLYIGAEHGKPAGDPAYATIAKRFTDFAPDVAFYEGTLCPGCGSAGHQTAETLYGESGLVQALAVKRHIPAHTLEPDEGALLTALAGRFDPMQVEVFQVLRYVVILRERMHVKPDEIQRRQESYIQTLRDQARGAGTTLPAPDFSAITSAYAKLWPGHSWEEARLSWFSPLNPPEAPPSALLFRRINAIEDNLRNEVMYQRMATAVLSGHRVFATVGRNHIPLQAPAFQCAVGRAGSIPEMERDMT